MRLPLGIRTGEGCVSSSARAAHPALASLLSRATRLRSRLTFILISKIYREMYADTGIATDGARLARSARWARWLAKPCQYLLSGRPMPQLQTLQL